MSSAAWQPAIASHMSVLICPACLCPVCLCRRPPCPAGTGGGFEGQHRPGGSVCGHLHADCRHWQPVLGTSGACAGHAFVTRLCDMPCLMRAVPRRACSVAVCSTSSASCCTARFPKPTGLQDCIAAAAAMPCRWQTARAAALRMIIGNKYSACTSPVLCCWQRLPPSHFMCFAVCGCCCCISAARQADRFGRRIAYFTSSVLFLGTSLACIFAPTIGVLVAFRALQGLAGGGER